MSRGVTPGLALAAIGCLAALALAAPALASGAAHGDSEGARLARVLKPIADYYVVLRGAIAGHAEPGTTPEDSVAMIQRMKGQKEAIEAWVGPEAILSEPLRTILRPLSAECANLLAAKIECDRREPFFEVGGGTNSLFAMFPCTRQAVARGDPDGAGLVLLDARKASSLMAAQADAMLAEAIAAYERLAGVRVGELEFARAATSSQAEAPASSASERFAGSVRTLVLAEAEARRRFDEQVSLGKLAYARAELALQGGQKAEAKSFFDQGTAREQEATRLAALLAQGGEARAVLRAADAAAHDAVVQGIAEDPAQPPFVRDYCNVILSGR